MVHSTVSMTASDSLSEQYASMMADEIQKEIDAKVLAEATAKKIADDAAEITFFLIVLGDRNGDGFSQNRFRLDQSDLARSFIFLMQQLDIDGKKLDLGRIPKLQV